MGRSARLAGLALAGLLVGMAGAAFAQAQPAYRCGARTYSDRPCSGGREVGAPTPRGLDRRAVPPQDRAKAARRAELTPAARAECTALDGRMLEQQAVLAQLPQPVTPADERELVRARLRFRQLHC